MPEALNVIALISGGKDSLFSILHCLENGHNIVALANLYPAPSPHVDQDIAAKPDVDDIESFMYQTIGHQIIPLYSGALGLPLYRRAITGTATQTQRDYRTPTIDLQALDETEDLVPLLKEVLQHHPDANAVCTGAILSTYQRTRVESVAIRLGLTPLSYLWQYPFLPSEDGDGGSITGLLDDMATVGCEARLIKVATGGLDEGLLWADVCNARTRSRIVNGMLRFASEDLDALKAAVLGEGGEFETLALNGPTPLWKKRIIVDEASNTIIRGEGGTCFVKVGNPMLTEVEQDDVQIRPRLPRPTLLDRTFEDLQLRLANSSMKSLEVGPEIVLNRNGPFLGLKKTIHRTSTSAYVLNMQFPISVTKVELRAAIFKTTLPFIKVSSNSDEIEKAFDDFLSSVAFATLLVRSMCSFSDVNALWTSLFSSRPNPPARVTISCGDLLPRGTDFAVSMIVGNGQLGSREGLHVQSRSYWAPANIGPYSQSVTVILDSNQPSNGTLAYIAGQIPLVPSTMQLHSGSFVEQAVLSLQHLWRIGVVRAVDWWLYGIAYLEQGPREEVAHRAWTAQTLWRRIHTSTIVQPTTDDEESDSDLDAWDLKYGHHQQHPSRTVLSDGTHGTRHLIPNPEIIVPSSNEDKIPPFIVVEVCSLPRAAPIEWQALGTSKCVPALTTSCKTTNPLYSCLINRTDLKAGSTRESTITPISMQSYVVTIPAPETWPAVAKGMRNQDRGCMHQLRENISEAINEIQNLASSMSLQLAGIMVYSVLPNVADYLPEKVLQRGTIIPCISIWSAADAKSDTADFSKGSGAISVTEMLLGMIVRCER